MMIRNSAVRRYFREVNHLLPNSARYKKRMIHRIEDRLTEIASGHAELDYDLLVEQLGAPSQIAAACLDEMSPQEVVRQLRIRKRIFVLIAGAVLTALLMWGITVERAYQDFMDSVNGYYVETITSGKAKQG